MLIKTVVQHHWFVQLAVTLVLTHLFRDDTAAEIVACVSQERSRVEVNLSHVIEVQSFLLYFLASAKNVKFGVTVNSARMTKTFVMVDFEFIEI